MTGDSKSIVLLATVGGVGFLPFMPGTCASVIALAFWYACSYCAPLCQLLIVVMVAVLGFFAADRYARMRGEKDPSCVVIDEFLGASFALLISPHQTFLWYLFFFLFRLFDIYKIGPVKWAESLPNGWGIMVDDLLAGLLSFMCVYMLQQQGSFLVISANLL